MTRFRRFEGAIAAFSALGIAAILIAVGGGARPALAQQGGQGDDNALGNQACLSCHATKTDVVAFQSGETFSIQVDNAVLEASVHGVGNPKGLVACTDCHGPAPHETDLISPRDYRIKMGQRCANCHNDEGGRQADSVHAEAQASGNLNAATCVDCHGSHAITPAGEPRAAISQTCGACHQKIFEVYSDSVHGSALLEESNPDVPTCVNCHGVHDIGDPTTAQFRLSSPQLCANCHADAALMAKYGVSTAVFDTYVSDFHGTTVTLFEHQAPDQQVNKAVCYDCHGVHDIRRPDDPKSSVMKDNLLATCQKCHPNADANFPAAWMGHYIPDQDQNPLVYFVNVFYQWFIPGVVGFMLLLIATDVFRRVTDRLIKPKTNRAS